MFSEIKQSTGNVLLDRVSSPFYGAFIFSWMVWNWQIPYLTVFVSQERLGDITKVDYIIKHYVNYWHLIVLPLLSAIALVALVPYATNRLYKVHLKHEKERTLWKQQQEKEKLLSIEESAKIRNDIVAQEEKHRLQINLKDSTVEQQKIQIDELTKEKHRYKILYACYGEQGMYTDVTNTIARLVKSEPLTISNETMGGDPISGVYKELLVLYSVENKVSFLRAQEQEELLLSPSTGQLERRETPLAKQIQAAEALKNAPPIIPTLGSIFPGTWLIEVLSPKKGEETFKIVESERYFSQETQNEPFVHTFDIARIAIDISGQQLSFEKNAIHTPKSILAELRIITPGKEYEGIEHNDAVLHEVRYTRID